MTNRRLTVNQADTGARLDFWLSKKLKHSRQLLASQVKSGNILVNGQASRPSARLKAGQVITIALKLPQTIIRPEKIKLDVIYQDKHLVVINKRAGLVMYPAGQHVSGTLSNALKAKFGQFHLVHRLDKDTSGVVLVARTAMAAKFLKSAFKARRVSKTYLAVVRGRVTPKEADLDLPIKRGRSGRFETHSEGRPAQSHYRVQEYLRGMTLLIVTPKSGRTHQIRVHLTALGYPVVGDNAYGVEVLGLDRQFLHASEVKFIDWEGKSRLFSAPLPPDLSKFLNNAKR